MFEHRLKVLLIVLSVAGLALLIRLGQLQLVQAGYYTGRAQAALVQHPQPLPFIRGRILDRASRVLVSDEPCWDLTLDFIVIASDVGHDKEARRALLRRWKRNHPDLHGASPETLEQTLDQALERSWVELARFASRRAPVTPNDLRAEALDIFNRVRTVRRAVAARRGFDAPVAEERRRHSLVTSLSAEEQIAAREQFGAYPWIHVEPSSVRRFQGDETSMAHVLGRTGRVTAEVVRDDPNQNEPFAAYRAGETVGTSGVEWLAERQLRGRRGQLTYDRNGRVIDEKTVAAEHGQDVTLTIDRALQDELYRLLGDTVRDVPESSGGAIVVIDVPTREVRALVSYPSYDPAQFDVLYAQLSEDTDRLPLWFRAVASRYAPGSTIKPLVCLSGLMNGVITLDTRETCTGYLFDDYRSGWRCWQIHGTNRRKAHGSVNVVSALIGSCNIFMYRLGERLGVDRLCATFDMVGVGRPSGIGLREENVGINPTPSWLMVHKNMRVTPGTARLFAMGQGEVSMTPLQVANLMATYASGAYQAVRLLRSNEPNPIWTLPVSDKHMRAIRKAMYGVVNDPNGTAYDYARFVDDRFALVGKTGSATATPWPTSYRIKYQDGHGTQIETVVRAGSRQSAIDRFLLAHPAATFNPDDVLVASHWPVLPPPPGQRHAHAWFGGFLQPLSTDGQPDWTVTPRFAFAALVEFGGSGGRVTGPLAKRIARTLVDFDRSTSEVARLSWESSRP